MSSFEDLSLYHSSYQKKTLKKNEFSNNKRRDEYTHVTPVKIWNSLVQITFESFPEGSLNTPSVSDV